MVLQELLRNFWFHAVFQITVFAIWAYWYWHVPLPGKALIALTIAAALMSLDIAPMQRIVWLVLVFGMAFMENRAIDHDRAKFVKDQQTFSNTQEQNFNKIGEGIKAAIADSDAKFAKTMDLSNRQFRATIGTLTGGESYAVVVPILNQRPNEDPNDPTFGMKIQIGRNSERNSLINANVYNTGNRPYPEPRSKFTGFMLLQMRIFSGTVDPGYAQTALGAFSVPRDRRPTAYTIEVYARNGVTSEILNVKPEADNRWEYSYEVQRDGRLVEKSKAWQQIKYLEGIVGN
jgi:hypothetical protein